MRPAVAAAAPVSAGGVTAGASGRRLERRDSVRFELALLHGQVVVQSPEPPDDVYGTMLI